MLEGNRGGVENTRLEAKATDAKKIRGQGQGQSYRGQTLSRPRTGMLEAKAEDQEHKRKCSPKKKTSKIFFRRSPNKKKVFKIIFQAISRKNCFPKNFSGALQTLTTQKKVLPSSREQGNFLGLEASRPRPRSSKCVLEDSPSGRQCILLPFT